MSEIVNEMSETVNEICTPENSQKKRKIGRPKIDIDQTDPKSRTNKKIFEVEPIFNMCCARLSRRGKKVLITKILDTL